MSEDLRKKYILKTATNYLSKDSNALVKFENDSSLNRFLDDLNTTLLVINDSNTISFSNKLDNRSTNAYEKFVVFFKAKPELITDENIKENILIYSIKDSPINSLYYLIHSVYSPSLSDGSKSNQIDSKLINAIAELESNLKVSIRKADENSSGRKSAFSPVDEFQYWSEKSNEKSKKGDDRERAEYFAKLFYPLTKLYENMHNVSLNEIIEIIETTQDVYDDIWKQLEYEPPYPQDRMINLLEITGMALLKTIQVKLGKSKVFEDSFVEVKEALKNSIGICERWSDCCKILTKNFWKEYSAHKWSGDEFVPISINKYGQRLKEIYEIRAASEQYKNLVNEDSSANDIFSSFSSIDPLQYNPFTEHIWKSAVSQYNRAMVPYDQKVSQILKTHLSKTQSNPQQLLREFLKFEDLIKRDKIKTELLSERYT